jgi:hypothetical protein
MSDEAKDRIRKCSPCDAQILDEPMSPGSRFRAAWAAKIEESLFGKRNRLEAREGVYLERDWTHRNRNFPD